MQHLHSTANVEPAEADGGGIETFSGPLKGQAMLRPGSPEADILVWLLDHEQATAFDVGEACGMAISSARGRLSFLAREKLVLGTRIDGVAPTRVYAVTGEGRRAVIRCALDAVGMSDLGSHAQPATGSA